MDADLALDALEGVVDRLGVAVELLADHLVGVTVEVERQHAALELGENAGQAGDQALQLLAGDLLVGGIANGRAGQNLLEGCLRVGTGGRRRLAERDVLVERGVLVAGRGLDRGDDLTRDAELREVAEARLAVGAVVANRLVEAHQALLDQVVGVATDEEVRGRLEAHEPVVALDDLVVRILAPLLCQSYQIMIIKLDFRVRPEVPCTSCKRGSSHRMLLYGPIGPEARWRTTSPGARCSEDE